MKWIYYSVLGMLMQGILLFIVKILAFDVHPLNILAFQYIGSLIIVFPYLLFKKVDFKLKLSNFLKIMLAGFLVATGLSFYYLAISLSEASRVVPIHSIGLTLVPALLAFVFLKEKITKRLIAGLICSILCVIFLTI